MASLKNVMNALKAKRNGTFFFLKYRSEVPVKAEYKKQGINVVKYTEKFVRTGINYNHIKSVIEKKSAPDYVAPAPRENNKEWLVDNKLFYNTNTDTYYARFGFCNGKKAKIKYIAYGADGNEIEFNKDYAINSFWNKNSNDAPSVFDLKVDNILSIS